MYRDVYNIFFNDFVFCVREMDGNNNSKKFNEIAWDFFIINSFPYLHTIYICTVHDEGILNILQWVQSAQSIREQSTSQTPRWRWRWIRDWRLIPDRYTRTHHGRMLHSIHQKQPKRMDERLHCRTLYDEKLDNIHLEINCFIWFT